MIINKELACTNQIEWRGQTNNQQQVMLEKIFWQKFIWLLFFVAILCVRCIKTVRDVNCKRCECPRGTRCRLVSPGRFERSFVFVLVSISLLDSRLNT